MVIQTYNTVKKLAETPAAQLLLVEGSKDKRLHVLKKIDCAKEKKGGTVSKLQQAVQETRMLFMLRHRHIIELRDFLVKDDTFSIVMEFAEKGDLTKKLVDHIQRKEHLHQDQVLMYLTQVCEGLAYAHDMDIIHRDIKPQNIFVTTDTCVKVGDFGVCKVLQTAGEVVEGPRAGTRAYMSPEVYNIQKYTSKADVWSVGVVLYEMLTLVLPHVGHSTTFEFDKIPSGYDPVFRSLCEDMLKLDADLRPSMREILSRVAAAGVVPSFMQKSNIAHPGAVRAGVGIVFEPDFYGALHVVDLAPGGAADLNGIIRVHDTLIQVNGNDVHKQELGSITEMILGPPGTHVNLAFLRGSDQIRVSLVRSDPARPHAETVSPAHVSPNQPSRAVVRPNHSNSDNHSNNSTHSDHGSHHNNAVTSQQHQSGKKKGLRKWMKGVFGKDDKQIPNIGGGSNGNPNGGQNSSSQDSDPTSPTHHHDSHLAYPGSHQQHPSSHHLRSLAEQEIIIAPLPPHHGFVPSEPQTAFHAPPKTPVMAPPHSADPHLMSLEQQQVMQRMGSHSDRFSPGVLPRDGYSTNGSEAPVFSATNRGGGVYDPPPYNGQYDDDVSNYHNQRPNDSPPPPRYYDEPEPQYAYNHSGPAPYHAQSPPTRELGYHDAESRDPVASRHEHRRDYGGGGYYGSHPADQTPSSFDEYNMRSSYANESSDYHRPSTVLANRAHVQEFPNGTGGWISSTEAPPRGLYDGGILNTRKSFGGVGSVPDRGGYSGDVAQTRFWRDDSHASDDRYNRDEEDKWNRRPQPINGYTPSSTGSAATLRGYRSSLDSEGEENEGPNRAGVGMRVTPDSSGSVYVIGLVPGSSAHDSGMVTVGDCIYEVDGVDVSKKPVSLVNSLIYGPPGTDVVIGLKKFLSKNLTFVRLRRRPASRIEQL